MLLSSLPAPKRAAGGDGAAAGAAAASGVAAATTTRGAGGSAGPSSAAAASAPPPYGARRGFVPRRQEDFGDGGAYPEIRVAQFPLNMGKPGGGGGGGKPSTNALAVATVAPTSAIAGTSANASTSSSSSRALVLGTTADGQPDYAAVVRQGHSAGVTVAADHSALVPKLDLIADPERHLARPAPEDEAATVAATRAALDAVVSGKIASVAPKNVARPPGAATYIKYTPKPGPLAAAVAGSSGSASHQQPPMTRIVKMQEMPVDPLEPPKFRHTKAPRGPGSPPVPVMHSPPRKVSAEEAADWKVPPCVSNWKNAKGYTIPLDKRLAADGRGLQETAINDGFAKFAEALYVAEHSAREAVELRAAVGRELAGKEREAKERQLRELAAAARAERVGGGGGGGGGFGVGAGAGPSSSSDRAPSIASVDLPPPPPRGGGGGGGGGGDDWSDLPPPPPRRTVDDRGGGDEDDDEGGPRARGDDDEDDETPAERAERRRRDEIRAERKREREREARLEAAGGKRSRGARDADRDISEKVALGQAALGGASGARGISEAQYDQRLFNQDGGGLDAGLGAEDSYNLYDKPLFADRGKSIYRPRRGGGDEGGGEDEGGVGGRAFKPDVGFAGADGGGAAGGSSGPVRFEREQQQQQQVEQHEGGPSSAAAAAAAPADDPFGIDAFVSSVSSKRAAAAAKNKGGSGSMRAAGGGGSAEDYLEGGGGSSRSKVAFERGKGT